MVETAEFEEVESNKTKLTATAIFSTIEDLEGMVTAGMEWGEREGFERLTELLSTLNK